MYGLVAHNKPRLTRLAQVFQDNLIGLDNSQTFTPNISNFISSQTPLILVVHNTTMLRPELIESWMYAESW